MDLLAVMTGTMRHDIPVWVLELMGVEFGRVAAFRDSVDETVGWSGGALKLSMPAGQCPRQHACCAGDQARKLRQ
jgi:uncharacterized protein YijF (DUF1287 family)